MTDDSVIVSEFAFVEYLGTIYLLVTKNTTQNVWTRLSENKKFDSLTHTTSAPVARVYSHGGLFMHLHHAHQVEVIVFTRCNANSI